MFYWQLFVQCKGIVVIACKVEVNYDPLFKIIIIKLWDKYSKITDFEQAKALNYLVKR